MSRRLAVLATVLACGIAVVAVVLGGLGGSGEPEPGRELSGGEGTVFDTSREAFSLALRNLPSANRRAFVVGNSLFNRNWVTAPASTSGQDGLGPMFNGPVVLVVSLQGRPRAAA